MRLLIPVFSPATGTWGGLTRVLAIAEAAQQAGHRVAFCASGNLYALLQQRGYTVYPIPATNLLGLPAPLSRVLVKRSQRATLPVKPGRDFGNIWFILFILGMPGAGNLKRLVAAEQRAAQDFGADAIFTDLDPGAYLLAKIAGLPIATAYQSPMANGIGSLPWKLANRTVNSVMSAYHLPAQRVNELFHGPQVLKIIPSIPELEGVDPRRPDVCYVGQLLGDIQARSGFRPEAGKRYVFVYLGTGAVSLETSRAALPRVFPAGENTIALLGAQSIPAVERIGAVEFRPYVPAADVLPYCDWTICHGGQNTIIQSLLNGVPLLVFPGPIFERRYNARKVQAAGAGLMGELNEFTPEWIGSALNHQTACAEKASQLSERIRAYGGAPAAVDAMGRWVSERKI